MTHLVQPGRRLHRRLPMTLVASTLALTACGGTSYGALRASSGQQLAGFRGDGGAGVAPAQHDMASMHASAGATTAQRPGQPNSVAINNFAFGPQSLTVRVGTTVTWINGDADQHTITSKGGGPLNSKPIDTGGSFTFRFSHAGVYPYYCQIHPFMTGTVTVTP